MRILVVTPYLPWPLTTGGNAAQFASLQCLMADHEFTVVSLLQSSNQSADLRQLGRLLPRVRFVAAQAGNQAFGLASASPAIRVARKVYRETREIFVRQNDARPLPDYPFAPLPAQLIQVLEQELEKGVDLCQVEFAQMMPLGAWLPAELPKIFIHHQIHFIYAQRFIQSQGLTGYAGFLEATIRAQEIAFLKYFNTVVTFSREDAEILRPLLSGTPVINSPFPLPTDVAVTPGAPAPYNGTFCFVASETHFPNRDALNWLLTEIWPRISAALPEAKLNIVGAWSEKAKGLCASPQIHFTGFVPELASVMKGSVLLVPLRIGSGIRVKILAAMALGAPVVTTTVGGEGIEGADGKEMLVRDSADEFAAAAIELSRSPGQWQKLGIASREAVVKNYSPESVRTRRNEMYNNLRLPKATVGGAHAVMSRAIAQVKGGA